jgi:hypothetical protein
VLESALARFLEVRARQGIENRDPERDWQKQLMLFEGLVEKSGRQLIIQSLSEGSVGGNVVP